MRAERKAGRTACIHFDEYVRGLVRGDANAIIRSRVTYAVDRVDIHGHATRHDDDNDDDNYDDDNDDGDDDGHGGGGGDDGIAVYGRHLAGARIHRRARRAEQAACNGRRPRILVYLHRTEATKRRAQTSALCRRICTFPRLHLAVISEVKQFLSFIKAVLIVPHPFAKEPRETSRSNRRLAASRSFFTDDAHRQSGNFNRQDTDGYLLRDN